ncbi:hypothetical protein BJ742DRAFT_738009 [Cladochytrium replicatum]|nr:hypothetical protein BJ742DRAFT_738009 [Cladochytrium replicatum]
MLGSSWPPPFHITELGTSAWPRSAATVDQLRMAGTGMPDWNPYQNRSRPPPLSNHIAYPHMVLLGETEMSMVTTPSCWVKQSISFHRDVQVDVALEPIWDAVARIYASSTNIDFATVSERTRHASGAGTQCLMMPAHQQLEYKVVDNYRMRRRPMSHLILPDYITSRLVSLAVTRSAGKSYLDWDELQRSELKIQLENVPCFSDGSEQVTLVTHTSLKQLAEVDSVVANWPGPVSVAIYIADASALPGAETQIWDAHQRWEALQMDAKVHFLTGALRNSMVWREMRDEQFRNHTAKDVARKMVESLNWDIDVHIVLGKAFTAQPQPLVTRTFDNARRGEEPLTHSRNGPAKPQRSYDQHHPYDFLYPVQTLRNLALMRAKTDFVLVQEPHVLSGPGFSYRRLCVHAKRAALWNENEKQSRRVAGPVAYVAPEWSWVMPGETNPPATILRQRRSRPTSLKETKSKTKAFESVVRRVWNYDLSTKAAKVTGEMFELFATRRRSQSKSRSELRAVSFGVRTKAQLRALCSLGWVLPALPPGHLSEKGSPRTSFPRALDTAAILDPLKFREGVVRASLKPNGTELRSLPAIERNFMLEQHADSSRAAQVADWCYGKSSKSDGTKAVNSGRTPDSLLLPREYLAYDYTTWLAKEDENSEMNLNSETVASGSGRDGCGPAGMRIPTNLVSSSRSPFQPSAFLARRSQMPLWDETFMGGPYSQQQMVLEMATASRTHPFKFCVMTDVFLMHRPNAVQALSGIPLPENEKAEWTRNAAKSELKEPTSPSEKQRVSWMEAVLLARRKIIRHIARLPETYLADDQLNLEIVRDILEITFGAFQAKVRERSSELSKLRKVFATLFWHDSL